MKRLRLRGELTVVRTADLEALLTELDRHREDERLRTLEQQRRAKALQTTRRIAPLAAADKTPTEPIRVL